MKAIMIARIFFCAIMIALRAIIIARLTLLRKVNSNHDCASLFSLFCKMEVVSLSLHGIQEGIIKYKLKKKKGIEEMEGIKEIKKIERIGGIEERRSKKEGEVLTN